MALRLTFNTTRQTKTWYLIYTNSVKDIQCHEKGCCLIHVNILSLGKLFHTFKINIFFKKSCILPNYVELKNAISLKKKSWFWKLQFIATFVCSLNAPFDKWYLLHSRSHDIKQITNSLSDYSTFRSHIHWCDIDFFQLLEKKIWEGSINYV